MANPEVVNSETGQHQEPQSEQIQIQAAVIIGWDENGKFVVGGGLDPFRTLAMIKKAELYVLRQIPADNDPGPKVVGVGGIPPGMADQLRGQNSMRRG